MWNLSHITFAHHWVLWLIPVAIVLCIAWWYLMRQRMYPSLVYSDTSHFAGYKKSLKGVIKKYIPLWRILPVVCLLLALARPQSSYDEEKRTTEGIDIVLAVDVSSSMLARDFKPNRLDAAKQVALDFIDGRPSDRIGLVVFSGESFTQCPVTIDHAILKNQLREIKNGLLEDGTAIGMGLATAVQRLKDTESKTKVVILMTDGVNNRGLIDPATASDIAMQFGARCYTIGVGTNGMAYTPVAMDPSGNLIFDNAEVQIDEAILRDISKKTGGQYFRATDNKKLKDIFQQIDKLEKTKINISAYSHKTEKFHLFALIGLCLLLLEWLLRYTWLRTIP
jgi:Ca-activated chloride channel homolog